MGSTWSAASEHQVRKQGSPVIITTVLKALITLAALKLWKSIKNVIKFSEIPLESRKLGCLGDSRIKVSCVQPIPASYSYRTSLRRVIKYREIVLLAPWQEKALGSSPPHCFPKKETRSMRCSPQSASQGMLEEWLATNDSPVPPVQGKVPFPLAQAAFSALLFSHSHFESEIWLFQFQVFSTFFFPLLTLVNSPSVVRSWLIIFTWLKTLHFFLLW